MECNAQLAAAWMERDEARGRAAEAAAKADGQEFLNKQLQAAHASQAAALEQYVSFA